MQLYLFLDRIGWPRSYLGKILFISFVGVHIPMIGAVSFVLLADTTPIAEQLDVLVAMLLATLIGTAATMLSMRALLSPVRQATHAMDRYLREKETPMLPARLEDEAGILMASIQEGITRLDSALAAAELHHRQMREAHTSKFELLSGMGHEFRTPLNHILGFAELMKAEAMGPLGEPAYRQFVSTIGESGQQLLSVLQSVLELSETEAADAAGTEFWDTDIVRLTGEAVALEHLHAEKKEVVVRQAGVAAANALVDRDAAKQAVSVLLQIAIECSGPGDVIDVIVDDLGCDQGGELTVAIRDRGRALVLEDVPPELRPQVAGLKSYVGGSVFGEASKLSSSPTAVRLSLVASLARLLGAKLSITADGEAGKTCTLAFSRRTPELRAEAA